MSRRAPRKAAARWGGNYAIGKRRTVLAVRGTICHLCGLEGADSPDHDPPRSVLIAAGVADPDALRYLFPAHLKPCNLARQDRDITPELRAELRQKRLTYLSGPAPLLSPLWSHARTSDEPGASGDSGSVIADG